MLFPGFANNSPNPDANAPSVDISKFVVIAFPGKAGISSAFVTESNTLTPNAS